MKDWKEYLPTFKEFFNTLAGKLTAILAFALLVIIALSFFGASIPNDYRALVYIVVIGAMLISGYLGVLQAQGKQQVLETPRLPTRSKPAKSNGEAEPQIDELVNELPLTEAEALSVYLDSIITDNRPLRLDVIDEHAGDPNRASLSLEKIYVDLNTTTPFKKEIEEREEKGEERLLPVIKALENARNHRMVLLGFPGTGKSTFVRYLALMIAQEIKGDIREVQGWEGKAILPMPLSLGRFAETLSENVEKGNARFLKKFIMDTLKRDKRTKAFAPYFYEYVAKFGALFLFDGLDEVAKMDLRSVVVQSIEAFVQQLGRDQRNYFLVTCRTYSYQDPKWQLTGWEKHELALLDDEQIRQFVQVWYAQHAEINPRQEEEYEEKREKLLEALQPSDRRNLYEVARYPIILTVMAVVHASYELPDSRAQVYERCVDLLLEKWNVKRAIMGREKVSNILAELDVPRTRIDQALWEIAYEAHLDNQKNGTRNLVTERLVSGVMTEYLKEQPKVEVFLDYCEQANGLLMLQGKVWDEKRKQERLVYTFPHLTFEEYLAARYLDSEDGDFLRNLLDQSFDRWREVAMLLGEHLCFASPRKGQMNDILRALVEKKSLAPNEKDWRAAWLAGELLTLYKRAFPKESPYEEKIMAALLALVEAAALSPRERADVADLLDSLGYRPKDQFQFVQIPAPLSLNGSSLSDGAEGSFYIAKTLVTNEAYARFLAAPDFHEEDFWLDFPKFTELKDAKTMEGITEDGNWGKKGYEWLKKNWNEDKKVFPRYWGDPRFGLARPSAPVNGITWYESNAYCKWLQAHWDELSEAKANPDLKPRLIRLPTESEWIFAAGGEEDEHFAWGRLEKKEEITRYANTSEGEIHRTTPVWMYPAGASMPHGLMDMSGNLWEWQANYRNQEAGWLALRGGSWDNDRDSARVAIRDGDSPGDSNGDLSFRLFLLPSL